jgi:hypothetical protein
MSLNSILPKQAGAARYSAEKSRAQVKTGKRAKYAVGPRSICHRSTGRGSATSRSVYFGRVRPWAKLSRSGPVRTHGVSSQQASHHQERQCDYASTQAGERSVTPISASGTGRVRFNRIRTTWHRIRGGCYRRGTAGQGKGCETQHHDAERDNENSSNHYILLYFQKSLNTIRVRGRREGPNASSPQFLAAGGTTANVTCQVKYLMLDTCGSVTRYTMNYNTQHFIITTFIM